MEKQKYGIIVAATPRGEIGFKNTIPWRLKGDLLRFKQMTTGQVIIYGRNTLESFPGGKPLPGRANIILSTTMTQADVKPDWPYTYVAANIDDALQQAAKISSPWVYFVGGAKVYEDALKFVTCAHVTLVHQDEGHEYDTRIEDFCFPESDWHMTAHQTVMECDGVDFPVPSHSFLEYTRLI